MSRNGSGTYSLPEPPFVPNTPISSSAVNSDLSDIAAALTGSVAADGQTPITGQIKFANGSLGSPSISFVTDTNTGIYRVSADVLGLVAGGNKIFSISSIQALMVDGTVAAPGMAFEGDPASGFYRIGSSNIGISVGGVKIADITPTNFNVTGNLQVNGAALPLLSECPFMLNGTIVESNATNAVTFAIKTLAGNDPSASDPVTFIFRSTTAGSGAYTTRQVTSALALTISSGSTLGFVNGVPAKVWLVAFDTGSTAVLGAINTISGTTIYPLAGWGIASSTAEGGSGGADSAQVFYTAAAQTSKAYMPIAYAAYETGLATAGSWNASPTRIQLFGANVRLPGVVVQTVFATNSTTKSTTSLTYVATNLTANIIPSSAVNLIKVSASGLVSTSSGSTNCLVQLTRGTSTQFGNQGGISTGVAITGIPLSTTILMGVDSPRVTTSTSYSVYIESGNGSSVSWSEGNTASSLLLEELMT